MDRSAVPTDTFRDMFVGYLIGTWLWRRRFGADPRVVGRVVEVFGDEYSFRIAGVMPETFAFPPGIETWSVSLPMRRGATRSGVRSLWAIARLRHGVTLQAAQADLTSVIVAFGAAVVGGLPALGRTPEEALRSNAPTYGGRRVRLGFIVAGEVALATVLVTAAALLCLYLAAQTGLQVTGPPGGL